MNSVGLINKNIVISINTFNDRSIINSNVREKY